MILLEGKGLNKNFVDKEKKTEALINIDFVLNEKEVLGIVGESGSGKSTLLKVISGMMDPDSGDLYYMGNRYTGEKPGKTGDYMQVIFQNPKSAFDPRMTMERSLMENNRHGRDRDKLLELIKKVGLDEDLLKRKPSELSGGQCQRMAIARAFFCEARILLCDEITSALDVTTQAQVIELLADLKSQGLLSAVFVSHDIALVSMLCDRVMVMKDGRCVESGDTIEIISNPENEYTQLLIGAAKRQSVEYGSKS